MPSSDPETAALIVAAGRGSRAGGDIAKQYREIGGHSLLRHAAGAFVRHPAISRVHVVVAAGEESRAADALGPLARQVSIGTGGDTRQQSVLRGLEALAANPPARVLVHDAARPFVPATLIDRVAAALAESAGACPALPVVDSLRRGTDHIEAEVDREALWRVQTPQGFDFQALLSAHRMARPGATDDTEVLRRAGLAVRLVKGDERAMKITGPEDFAAAERLIAMDTRVGMGFDVHRFGPGDHVWLCGVAIPHTHGLVGHSDADAGLHALTDAVLGALAEGDIGQHFPPADPQWKGASSDRFLAHAAGLARNAGGRIVHCDVTLICESPKIGPWRDRMTARVAEILADHQPVVSIKATTTERLGFAGRGEGIAAQAVATLRLPAAGMTG